jgi:hypothetical protein
MGSEGQRAALPAFERRVACRCRPAIVLQRSAQLGQPNIVRARRAANQSLFLLPLDAADPRSPAIFLDDLDTFAFERAHKVARLPPFLNLYFFCRFRNRTPSLPPFSSMNATPA